MKACEHCGYTFEHNTATCKALVAERKTKIHHIKSPRKNAPGLVNISRKNIVELADYLNGKRQ